MAPLQGRHVLITGAARGIGAAIALGLARDGHAVAINYASSAAAAEALAARLPELLAQIAEIKRFYGLREQRLEQLLAA